MSELIKGKIYQFHAPDSEQVHALVAATIGGPPIGKVSHLALVIYLEGAQAWKKIIVGELAGWVFGYLHEVDSDGYVVRGGTWA